VTSRSNPASAKCDSAARRSTSPPRVRSLLHHLRTHPGQCSRGAHLLTRSGQQPRRLQHDRHDAHQPPAQQLEGTRMRPELISPCAARLQDREARSPHVPGGRSPMARNEPLRGTWDAAGLGGGGGGGRPGAPRRNRP
jgi:hypothetical protein